MKRTFAILVISSVLMLNIIPASSDYSEEKSYNLAGDAYIDGRAKIACWQYGTDEPKVHIKIDIVKAFRAKGGKLLSAYIIDLAKNGPESYLQIGKPKFPYDKYDYTGFSQLFTGKDFPPVDGAKACPIDSIGRIVVVVGTSSPSDSDTLSQGDVDIIAEVALSPNGGEASVSTGEEEPKAGTQTPQVEEPEVEEAEVEEPKVRVDPYSISEPKLVDHFGDRIDRIFTGEPIIVETEVTNNLEEEQSFIYILQVKDSNGFTVMLTWIKGTMRAFGALDPGISWTPEETGDYSIEIFVWKSLEDPGLPLTKSMMVSIEK
ncbi:MAG: hypothetical protein ACE5J2_05555 [Nitrososphaerales archaeon]